MVVPVLLLTLGAAAVLIGATRRWPRLFPNPHAAAQSPVAFQHLQLFQGGLINPRELESAKSELGTKLAVGGVSAAETCLRAGTEFAVQVRALAEIGTEEAGRVLERQLGRRISSDPVEQSWYLLDIAQGLRGLNRPQSLPLLLRCAEKEFEYPLGSLFAAEIVSFPQFASHLQEPLVPLGQAAVRALRLAMEGVRRGFIPVTLYSEAQIGELIRRLSESCPDRADAALARLFLEAMRHARRSYQTSPELRDDPVRRQGIRWQTGYLRDSEPILREYLHDIGEDLARMLPHSSAADKADILAAIHELHADAGAALLDALADEQFSHRAAAIGCLQWSSGFEVAHYLCEQARRIADATPRRWRLWPRRGDMSPPADLMAVLQALRGHPCEQAENILREFARHPLPAYRIAAINSLGWWEPICRSQVIEALHVARIDGRAEVRMAAIGALARLGECAALQVLRESLSSQSPQAVHQAIEAIASEGLTWLWPELDLLTESDDAVIAHHAWEAIEGLRESILGPLA